MPESIPPAGWAAIATVVGTLVAWATTRNKNTADTAAVLSETALEWIRELRDENDRLDAQLNDLRADNSYLRRRGIALEARLVEEGVDPTEIDGPFGDPPLLAP